MKSTPIRVGLFFGGASREREASFLGGRTLYDYLDRNCFEPVPVFVDSLGNFILIHWQYLYHGSIRECYPPPAPNTTFWGIPLYVESCVSKDEAEAYTATIGKKIAPEEFASYFDVAFLCLYGPYGEDGSIQGILQWYQMPYTGSGLLPAALGLNKIVQQPLLKNAGFLVAPSYPLSQQQWLHTTATNTTNGLLEQVIATIGIPFVVKSSKQGSSIGVTIVQEADPTAFAAALNSAFFMEELDYTTWQTMAKKEWLHKLIDIRNGIGFPLLIDQQIFYKPATLLEYIETHFQNTKQPLWLMSAQAETAILLEAYIEGREFSCVVLEDEKGKPIALPPTEILKGGMLFDYRAKYLPGIIGKQTPINVEPALLQTIRAVVTAAFQLLHCQVYARIDGFLTKENQIFLNDPNTTVGIHPSSHLFHQAATIGLNPTQLLTFIIKRSLETRKEEGFLNASVLLKRLKARL
ncbi:D-alanine--D-alanine ligase family protein [Candidatus Cardinium hertigii]|nr:hypothetical protein [Candidatus Cardinium hertigii]